MRLFRRTLLCLVVGVTAFGVAGWGFRPKASWTTVVGEKDQLLRFVEPIDRLRPSGLIWIQTRFQNELWSFDARTGEPAAKLPLQEFFDEAYVLPDGRVLTQRSTSDGDRIADTRYSLYSGEDGKLLHHRTLRPARWMLAPDGLRAFTDADVNDKLTIEFRSLDSDRTEHFTLTDSDGIVAGHSRDGKRWAVVKMDREARTPIIEVWDIPPGGLVARAKLKPSKDGGLTVGRGFFDEAGQRVVFTYEMDPWEFNLRTGVARALEFPNVPRKHAPGAYTTDPPGPTDRASVRRVRDSRRHRAFIAQDDKPDRAWLAVEEADYELSAWRPLSLPLVVRRDHMGFTRSVDALSAPGGAAVVVHSLTPPVIDQLPTWVRQFVPQNWKDWRTESRQCTWHDLSRNTWHATGCVDSHLFEVRPEAILATRMDDQERTILESFPLPPRDPKWPALGVAALGAAGTWWACARRYRRRMKLQPQSVGAS